MSLGQDIVEALGTLSVEEKGNMQLVWEVIGDVISTGGNIEWSPVKIYKLEDIVEYGGELYVSFKNNNIDKQPDTEIAYWKEYYFQNRMLDEMGIEPIQSGDEDIPDSGELFEFNIPDVVSSEGRIPLGNPILNYFPSKITEQGIEIYDNPWRKWNNRGVIGIFQDTNNMLDSPEDMTTTSWANLHSTDVLSDLYFDGMRFTKVIGDNTFTFARVGQDLGDIASGIYSAQAVFKRDDVVQSRLDYWDGTSSKLAIDITWATKTVVASAGTLDFVNWYGDNIVHVGGHTITTAVPGLNDRLLLYPVYGESGNTTKHSWVTGAIVEETDYCTPYTATSRPAGQMNYPLAMPPKFTLMFWVRPWFVHNTGTDHRFIEWYIDNTHRLMIFYYQSDVSYKITVLWMNAGTNRFLRSQQFDDGTSHDDINQPIHVAAKIDLTAGQTGSSLWINGVKRDDDWGGAPDAYSDYFSILSLGHENGGFQGDSLFTDFLFVPSLLADSVITSHYTANRPFYSENRILGKNCNFRMDSFGNAYFKNMVVR